nr:IS3 family transposase [Vagococcus acidifermentans]
MAIKELVETKKYKVNQLCSLAGVSTSGYYKWKNKVPQAYEIETEKLANEIKRIFIESDYTYGVVRMQVALKRELNLQINIKKIRRLMRLMNLYPEIRRKRANWIKTKPDYTYTNIINRDFVATKPNQKWFTDISYLFYGKHQKAYISAIIDRYDMSIVSYIIGKSNNNELVMKTIEQGFKDNPNTSPIIHSDRGFQYTSNSYKQLSEKYKFEVSINDGCFFVFFNKVNNQLNQSN